MQQQGMLEPRQIGQTALKPLLMQAVLVASLVALMAIPIATGAAMILGGINLILIRFLRTSDRAGHQPLRTATVISITVLILSIAYLALA